MLLLHREQLARHGAEMLLVRRVDAVTPLPRLLVQILPVGEAAPRQEVALDETERPIAGADFAGRVESVGRDIKRFRPGDEVFWASFTGKGLGGFAEFARAGEDSLAPKPSNLSFEEAAAVPVAAITALLAVHKQ